MSSNTVVIIVAAVVGGMVVLSVAGLVAFLWHRRRRRRRQNERENRRLSYQTGSNVDLHQVQSYNQNTKARQPSTRKFITTKSSRGKKQRTQNLSVNRKSQDDNSSSSQDGSQQPLKKLKVSLNRRPTSGISIVDTSSVAQQQQQQQQQQPEMEELPDVYLPTGGPVRSPLTPISERDTPDSSSRALPRMGNQRSESLYNRRLIRSTRPSSPRWLLDPPLRATKSLSKKKDKSPTKRPGVLRSLSLHSRAAGPMPTEELPPTPDAIYDACTRLSPLPSHRFRHARTDSETEPPTPSSLSSVFDANASYTTVGSHFASIGHPSARSSKREPLPEGVYSELASRHDSHRSSIMRPSTASASMSASRDTLQINRGETSTLKRDKSSSMSLSLHDNWQTPSKDSSAAVAAAAAAAAATAGMHTERHVDSWHSKHPSETHSDQHYQSWHKREHSDGQPSSRGRTIRQALRESADGSNRQSSATTSPSSSSAPPRKSRHMTKPSREEEPAKRGKSASARTHGRKRSSTQRIVLQVSRPNSIAASAILEDEIFNASSAAGRSNTLPNIDLRPLKPSRSPNNRRGEPDSERSSRTNHHSTSRSFQDDSRPGSAHHRSGENVQYGRSPVVNDQEYHALTTPGDESEDLLHLPLEKPSSRETTDSDSYRTYLLPSPPALTPDETFEIKPIPPLRPRNSALCQGDAPKLNRASALESSPSRSHDNATTPDLIVPKPLRPRSSGTVRSERGSVATATLPPPSADSQLHSQTSLYVPIVRRQPSRDGQDGRRPDGPRFEQSQSSMATVRQSSLRRVTSSNPAPTEPLPPLPPAVPARNKARMTSMMMQLRRQNSDSSRADSTYFRLPQSQRSSVASHSVQFPNSNRSSNSNGNNNQSRLSRLAFGTNSSSTTPLEGSASLDDQRQRASRIERTVSLGSVSASSLIAARRAREASGSFAELSDPFLDKDKLEWRPRSSRHMPPEPMYLPGYEPFKPSHPSSQGRTSSFRSSAAAAAAAPPPMSPRDYTATFEHARPRTREEQQQQFIIGRAVEMAATAEPFVRASRDAHNAADERHPGTSTDDSERDLSPVGKRIMAQKRREHYDRQRAPASGGQGVPAPALVATFPLLATPSSSRPTTRGSTTQGGGQHRRNKSSVVSVFSSLSGHVDEDGKWRPAAAAPVVSGAPQNGMPITVDGRDDGAELDHHALGQPGQPMMMAVGEARRARRESQRQKVMDLKDRVASMEFLRRGGMGGVDEMAKE